MPEFNYQLESDWPIYRQLQFLWAGRKAYTEGSLLLIIDWIKIKIRISLPIIWIVIYDF